MELDVALEITNDGHAILAVKGEVDMHSSPRVREAQLRALKEGSRWIVIDLTGVGYMDSSGIATLIEGLQFGRSEGREFRLAGLSPAGRDVFEQARLADVFAIFPTRADALKGA